MTTDFAGGGNGRRAEFAVLLQGVTVLSPFTRGDPVRRERRRRPARTWRSVLGSRPVPSTMSRRPAACRSPDAPTPRKRLRCCRHTNTWQPLRPPSRAQRLSAEPLGVARHVHGWGERWLRGERDAAAESTLRRPQSDWGCPARWRGFAPGPKGAKRAPPPRRWAGVTRGARRVSPLSPRHRLEPAPSTRPRRRSGSST